MSFEITDNFVDQFSANFFMLAQQKESRFQVGVDVDADIVGQSKSVERIGAGVAADLVTRHGDTQYIDTPHSKRWIDLADKYYADLIDEMDKIRLLADPTSPYVRVAVQALNRAKDDVIIAALTGTARASTASGGSIVLPSAQKIAVGAAGLTVDKLLAAKQLLDEAEVDEEEDRFIATSAQQLSNLLTDPEVTSSDFVTVKALVEGKINTYLGFKFIRSERLNKVGNDRFCPAWAKTGLRLGIGKDVVASIDVLPGKNMSVQVYARQSLGAVRTEEVRVVEIACLET